MVSCPNLMSINLLNLPENISIGKYFLNYCPKLKTIKCSISMKQKLIQSNEDLNRPNITFIIV
jgi:hypothetical protein